MAIYEYECNQCGEPFEKLVRFSDADQIPACPKCESKDTRKKISAVVSFGTTNVGFSGSTSGSCGWSGGFT
jgi:putative FmdB family regulatory protein